MSTATEITRLTTARNTIRNKMVNFGLGESTDLLDDLASEIDSIVNRGAVSAQVQEGETYTIPAGYHNGSGTVLGVAGGGHYELQAKSATPTKSQQSITPDSGYYGLSAVTVAAIPEAYQDVSSVTAAAGDVLATKVFVASDGTVTAGTMPNNGAVSQTLNTTTTSYTIPAGYHNGSGTVSIVTETKSATPTTSAQDVTPSTGKVLSKVTVAAIPSNYKDTTNVDATAADVLSGKTIVTSSGEVEGAMPNNGTLTYNLKDATPSTDATTGAKTYSKAIAAGYYSGGSVFADIEASSTVTPTKSSQTVTPASDYIGVAGVTVNPIPEAYQDVTGVTATAADVLSGKKIVNSSGTVVTGSMANNGAVSKTLDATANNQSYTVPAGYHNGSGAVSITLEEKSATPTTSSQNITPTSGKVLSKVTVAAIPSKYGDVTGDDAVAANLLSGKYAHTSVNGVATQIEGTMVNNGAISGSINGLTTTSYSVPAGYTSGGTVSLTNDIELALAAI